MHLKRFFQQIKDQGRNFLTESESRQVLSKYEIKVVEGEIAETAQQAVKIAERIGYPVVLKIVSKDVLHKTDLGGVMLNIKTPEEVARSFDEIIKNVKSKMPHASVEGIFVQKMVQGYELIIGGKRDKVFGPVVMMGLGGIFVEALEDIAFRIAPIDDKEAVKMLGELKASKILYGLRGKPANIKEIAIVVSKLSKIIIENKEIAEIDINPLIASDKAIALDARIILD